MNRIESAVELFKKGFSCSQAIFSTFGKELGLDRNVALKIASAFGGGMGRMGKTCGAVTGAFIVIGLKYGQIKVENKQAKDKTYSLVKEFVKQFEAHNNSTICKELLGCDIGTPQGMQIAIEKSLLNTLCPKLVKDAAEILEGIL